VAGLAAAVTFLAILGLWNRQQSDPQTASSPTVPGGLVIESQARGTSLTAVGRITGLAEPCTAWLLDVPDAPERSQAFAVTTGRCAGSAGPDRVIEAQAVEGADVQFNAFAPLTSAVLPNLVTAPIEQVTYASSDGADLAVLRLGTSYGELADQGVRPIVVARPPGPGTEILVAGVPVDTITADQQYLRATRCAVGEAVEVAEQDWRWGQRMASDCQGMLGGSLGSPAFNPAGDVVAMVSTTSIGSDAGTQCADGAPCQVVDGDPTFVADTTYLTSLNELGSCFSGAEFTPGGECLRTGSATTSTATDN
jgi:hypothetical protein